MEEKQKRIAYLYNFISKITQEITNAPHYTTKAAFSHIRALRNRRDRIFQALYRLGEGPTSIMEATGWTIMTIYIAIRKDKERIQFLSLEKRFCSFCSTSFNPTRVSQIFCCRRCFKNAYYRDHLSEIRNYYALRPSGTVPSYGVHISGCEICNKLFKKIVATQKYCSLACKRRAAAIYRAKIVKKAFEEHRKINKRPDIKLNQ